jgi:hypothetical protein
MTLATTATFGLARRTALRRADRKTQRLSDRAGSCRWDANVSGDSKRLVPAKFPTREHPRDVEAFGPCLRNVRHFTLDKSINYTQDWTNDSGRVILLSMAPGNLDRTVCGWRRGWDSNPRDPFGPNGFQDRRSQPLSYPSELSS